MIAALSGTRIDRNTTISSRNDSATTARMKIGNRAVIRSDRSDSSAVRPPTITSASDPSTAAGITSLRSRCSVASVSVSCGDVVGWAVSTAVSPASLTQRRLHGGDAGIAGDRGREAFEHGRISARR